MWAISLKIWWNMTIWGNNASIALLRRVPLDWNIISSHSTYCSLFWLFIYNRVLCQKRRRLLLYNLRLILYSESLLIVFIIEFILSRLVSISKGFLWAVPVYSLNIIALIENYNLCIIIILENLYSVGIISVRQKTSIGSLK